MSLNVFDVLVRGHKGLIHGSFLAPILARFRVFKWTKFGFESQVSPDLAQFCVKIHDWEPDSSSCEGENQICEPSENTWK